MQRLSPRHSLGSTRAADAPERALTADWYTQAYKRWWDNFLGHEWPENSPEIEEAVERAVADLVDKHCIVPAERRDDWHAHPGLRGLRAWLEFVVVGYFDLVDIMESKPIGGNVERRQRRIAQLGDRLRKEIAQLQGLVGLARDFEPDIKRVIDPTQGLLVLDDYSSTRANNASKDAVRVLSRHICQFWQPSSMSYSPLDLSTSSGSFRFARYIFCWLGEGRSNRMIVERLRAAERELAAGQLDKSRRFHVFPSRG